VRKFYVVYFVVYFVYFMDYGYVVYFVDCQDLPRPGQRQQFNYVSALTKCLECPTVNLVLAHLFTHVGLVVMVLPNPFRGMGA